MTASDTALAQECLAEYGERVVTLRADLLTIAKGEAASEQEKLISRAFRAVHSVRGSGFFGFVKIAELAQKMEEVLVLIHSHRMTLKPYRVGVLLLATDRLHDLIENSGTSNGADIGRIVAALERLEGNHLEGCAENPASPAPPPRNEPKQIHTLAVDDDIPSQLLLRSFLSRFGDCDVAVDGRKAVGMFRAALERKQRYDFVCMDIAMPEMNGREALRQMRALEEANGIVPTHGASIVMMSAMDDMKEMIGSFQDFSDAYFVKPINLVTVLRHLKAHQLVW
jgi:two-component system chemotaxis response regulator CheY